jgi:hypothetical protein
MAPFSYVELLRAKVDPVAILEGMVFVYSNRRFEYLVILPFLIGVVFAVVQK